jgi:hypothetical protein
MTPSQFKDAHFRNLETGDHDLPDIENKKSN